MSVLRHSAWAAATAVALTGSRFVFGAILARRLSLTEFGQYAYSQWLTDITVLVCSLGAIGAIGRYVAEFRHEPGLLATVVRRWLPYAFGVPAVAAAVVPLAAALSGLSLGLDSLVLLALWTLASGLWAMQTAALSGLQRFDLTLVAAVVAGVILLGGGLLVPLAGHGPSRLFGLMALASACAAVVGYSTTTRLARGKTSPIDPGRWRGMLGYAINMWLVTLLGNLVWSRGEMPIVKAYLGDDGVARYAAALIVFGGAIQAVMLASSGVSPQLTRLWGEGAHLQAVALARKIMDTQLLICGVAAVVLIDLGPELMQLAFGTQFRAESATLAVLSLGLVALTVSCQNHVLQIATDGRFNRNTTLVGLLVLLLSAVVLVASTGVPGAALARAGTMLLMAAVSLIVVRRRWGAAAFSPVNIVAVLLIVIATAAIQPWVRDLAWPVRAALAMLAAGLLVAAVRDEQGRMQAKMVIARLRRASWSPAAVAGEPGPR